MSTPSRKQSRKVRVHWNATSIPDRAVGLSTVATLGARPRNFIAPKMITKLRFHERVPVSVLAGITNDYQFRLNSCFDPDFTGTGHQPYGYDQLTAIYAKYRVRSCAFQVSFFTDNSTPAESSLVCNNSSTAIVVNDVAAESSNCYGVKQHNNYQPCTIRGNVNLAFLNGETEAQYAANESTSSAYNANPTEVLQLHCSSVCSVACTVYTSVTLDMVVEFFDQFQLSQS